MPGLNTRTAHTPVIAASSLKAGWRYPARAYLDGKWRKLPIPKGTDRGLRRAIDLLAQGMLEDVCATDRFSSEGTEGFSPMVEYRGESFHWYALKQKTVLHRIPAFQVHGCWVLGTPLEKRQTNQNNYAWTKQDELKATNSLVTHLEWCEAMGVDLNKRHPFFS